MRELLKQEGTHWEAPSLLKEVQTSESSACLELPLRTKAKGVKSGTKNDTFLELHFYLEIWIQISFKSLHFSMHFSKMKT